MRRKWITSIYRVHPNQAKIATQLRLYKETGDARHLLESKKLMDEVERDRKAQEQKTLSGKHKVTQESK